MLETARGWTVLFEHQANLQALEHCSSLECYCRSTFGRCRADQPSGAVAQINLRALSRHTTSE